MGFLDKIRGVFAAAVSVNPTVPVEAAGESRTGGQIAGCAGGIYGSTLWNPLPASYKTYREVRKHPTIALARALSIAPVVAASWSVEADEDVPEDAKAFIEDELLELREPIIQTAMEGGVDFGWAPFEKVFEIREEDGRIGLKKLKPLIQDHTTILIDKNSGAFAGFRQPGPTGTPMDLSPEYCWLANFRVEGTQWYGQSLLENVREHWNAWKEGEAGARQYDSKIAGARWMVKYPPGASPTTADGEPVDHAVIAEAMLRKLVANGSIMLPRRLEDMPTDTTGAARDAWDVTFLADPFAKQYSFVARLQYLDKLFVRGLLLPERSVLEGQFGTKAEAGVHADLALTQKELDHRHITRLANRYIVDQLVELNFGRQFRQKVRLVANPLQDEKAAFFRELYKALITNPTAALELLSRVDWDWLSQSVGVKTTDEPQMPADPGVDREDPLAQDTERLLRVARGA